MRDGSSRRWGAVLAVTGIVSALGYALAARGLAASNRAGDVWTFLALFWALFLLSAVAFWAARQLGRRSPRMTLWLIFIFAVVFRLLMLLAGLGPGAILPQLRADVCSEAVSYETFLLYDNDAWRYLWDGHVQAHGFAPYAASPYELSEDDDRAASLLASELWADVLDNVSYQGHITVYPPLAQTLFLGLHRLAPGSMLALKAILILFDLGTCALLLRLLTRLGRPREELLLYAWNPLLIKEIAGSAHVDAVMIFWLTAALVLLIERRMLGALIAFAASIAAKLSPTILVGAVLARARPRWWVVLPLTLAALALPWIDHLPSMLRALAAYAREWEFNAGAWGVLRFLAHLGGAAEPERWAYIGCRILLLVIIVLATLRSRRDEESLLMACFVMLAALILLSPAVMPWYLLWALPLAVAVGNRSWIVLCALSFLSYLIYIEQRQEAWWLWLEYLGFGAAVILELRGGGTFARRLRTFVRGAPAASIPTS